MWNKILTCFFLQEFQRTVLENVSRKVQAATMESQGLIQSAAPGVDTSGLEADQESLMDKWNSLNAKVNILGITVWSLCDIQSISTKYASWKIVAFGVFKCPEMYHFWHADVITILQC